MPTTCAGSGPEPESGWGAQLTLCACAPISSSPPFLLSHSLLRYPPSTSQGVAAPAPGRGPGPGAGLGRERGPAAPRPRPLWHRGRLLRAPRRLLPVGRARARRKEGRGGRGKGQCRSRGGRGGGGGRGTAAAAAVAVAAAGSGGTVEPTSLCSLRPIKPQEAERYCTIPQRRLSRRCTSAALRHPSS